jgi:hypothetical protein
MNYFAKGPVAEVDALLAENVRKVGTPGVTGLRGQNEFAWKGGVCLLQTLRAQPPRVPVQGQPVHKVGHRVVLEDLRRKIIDNYQKFGTNFKLQ